MTALLNGIWRLKVWSDTRGQDLVEYALLGGFLASIAAAISPAVCVSLSTVFANVATTLASAGSGSTGSGHL